MIHFPNFDPVLVSFGPLKVHWYGLMYVFGFSIAWLLARHRARKPDAVLTAAEVDDLVFYGMLGIIIGARVCYMLFYNLPLLIQSPLSLFKTWDGGMSFHGGVIGLAITFLWFSRKIGKSIWELSDFSVPLVPLGLCLGRIGNFINGELWGRISDVPWAMVFPTGGPFPRHPSQLYEAFGEGLVLFIILWCYTIKPKPRMAASGIFLLGYGVIRFTIEFFRQPDYQLGFIAFNWMTMGQLLSLPMIAFGVMLISLAYFKRMNHATVS